MVEAGGAGYDTVNSSIDYVLPANVEKLALTGSVAIDGTGNALANSLIGNDADNVLDGGADTMAGGLGDDIYVVDASGDFVIERADEGVDTAEASISYALGADVENLRLLGSNNINATGNALDNALEGNSGNNLLNGDVGADRMARGSAMMSMSSIISAMWRSRTWARASTRYAAPSATR